MLRPGLPSVTVSSRVTRGLSPVSLPLLKGFSPLVFFSLLPRFFLFPISCFSTSGAKSSFSPRFSSPPYHVRSGCMLNHPFFLYPALMGIFCPIFGPATELPCRPPSRQCLTSSVPLPAEKVPRLFFFFLSLPPSFVNIMLPLPFPFPLTQLKFPFSEVSCFFTFPWGRHSFLG